MVEYFEDYKTELSDLFKKFFQTNDVRESVKLAEKLADKEESNKEWYDRASDELGYGKVFNG